MHNAAPVADEERDSIVPGIKRPVFFLSLVSLFADISSEMVYPLIPLFLTNALGAPVAAVGLIEGVAESTASITKTISGRLSDRWLVRKPFVVTGYLLAAIGKPLLAAATVWPAALGARFVDRLGKGIRTAPRDALLGDVTPPETRGRAFGFHRAMDTTGAVIGPALGLGLFLLFAHHYRPVFLVALIPALGSVALLALVREHKPKAPASGKPRPFRELGMRFYLFLGVSLLFAIGNSSDAFIILRSENLGLSDAETVAAYILYNAVYALLSFPIGALSDSIDRKLIIIAGFLIFAGVYLGFAGASTAALVWPLFAVYGVYMAMTDAVGRAYVVDVAPADARATAVGVYTGAVGACVLLASIIAGVLWDEVGSWAPFALGAGTAAASAILIIVLFASESRPSTKAA